MNLLDFPDVMLLEIFEYLSYDEVAKKRVVCRKFDQIAQQVLNRGFKKVIKQHNISHKRIKALLPRRESERRNHCLARHADILASIETRISMLSMTYTKYIDLNLCCFIPGRVLDEICRILNLISKTSKQLRLHEVLQELRDISSMAIEHFDEKIANTLKKTFAESNKMCSSSGYCPDTRRLVATGGLGNISFSGMGPSTSTFNSATISFNGNNTYILEPITQRLGVVGDLLNVNVCKPISPQSTLPSTSAGITDHQNLAGGQPKDRTTLSYFKKLESEYKTGILKIHRMQQVQNLQNKRLQQTLSFVTNLSVELKKRLEDIDAKNREISATIRRMSCGEIRKIDNINNSSNTATDKNNINEDTDLSVFPSTSSSIVSITDNANKRRIDAEKNKDAAEEFIEKPEDSCNIQVKKPKLDS